MITSQYETGDTIKSRTFTMKRSDGGMRYIRAKVIDSDIYAGVNEDREMLKVIDDNGNIHELWTESVFYHERYEE